MVIFPGKLQGDAVIFDFDGVIVDTEPLHYKAFQRILEPLGLGFTWERYVETYMGFDDRDAFLEAFNAKGRQISHEELGRLIAAKADLFQEVIGGGVTPYPGVVELITTLHGANVPLAICSGALHSDIKPILEMLNISGCFGVIVSADDVAKSKPDPECYRLAYEKLYNRCSSAAISRSRTIAVEDTPAGIAAAKGAGLQVVAVTNSYPREHVSEAACIVATLEELIDFRVT